MGENHDYLLVLTLLIFVTLLFPPLTSSKQCEDYSDCRSLLKFKSAITSDPDGNLQAWNATTSFCNWTGIKCHPKIQDKVISLQLINMKLQGTISPFISNLSFLTTLSLQDNSFYGSIPSTVGNLSQLNFLNMSGNKLRGSIPASIKGCQGMKTLDLTYNNLSGTLPDELWELKNLTYLALSVNNLTGTISDSISNLTELTDLELAVNYFTGKIPSGIGKMKRLQILYFHTNYFQGAIPASISNCSDLLEISGSENRLSGEIPIDLGNKLQNLQKLYLLMNQLSGKIPVTFSNLSQLTLLDLSLNKLKGEVPLELGKLKNLRILYLHSNDIVSGGDNSSFSLLTALTNCSFILKLHLGSCLFTGNLPDSIGSLSKNLYYFNLIDNRLTGKIPDSIGNLSSLVYLNLWHNFLIGKVPPSIGKLTEMERLYLRMNRLSGAIPDEIGLMGNLGFLDLSNNLLNGSIPSSLGNLSQLRYIFLNGNHLSGIFPVEVTKCSLLLLIDLSFNKLEGSLPIEIGRLSNLAFSLNLSNNYLGGELPPSIGKLQSVIAIDFSENNFTGFIPSSIETCISLEYLNLSNNMLAGKVPQDLAHIMKLQVFDLSFNKLTGNIPIWIGEAANIKKLNLSYNRLTGEIPDTREFENLGKSSFLGNPGLCGGSKSMGLPPCKVWKHRTKKWVYAVIAVGTCILLISVLFGFLWYRTYKKKTEQMGEIASIGRSIHGGSQTLTQREIEIATDEFNENNFLGRGSYGSVYKGMIDGERTIAVKVLFEENIHSFKSFKRECQILSGIKHRNLVKLIGAIWNPGLKAIILEFIENGNLEQHLYSRGAEGGDCELTLRNRLEIAIDIANGLEYLHDGCAVQIIHCDLKPQNVLLNNDMVAKIADFGIGKLISPKTEGHIDSTMDFLRGSVGYIPPEYGQRAQVSAKGDVYSFGIMLLELITRKRPTSETFSEGVDIRKWVNSAISQHILNVVDMSLKQEANAGGGSDDMHRLEQCCMHMLDVGIMCTEENPHERPPITVVVQRLNNVWKEMGFEMPRKQGRVRSEC